MRRRPAVWSARPDARPCGWPRVAGWFLAAALALAGRAAPARDVSIVLLHTTDLHGRIVNTLPDEDDGDRAPGLLRLATLIAEARAAHPNVLLVDCGDTFQGAPESYLTDGRIMTEAFTRLRYDAWVIGNHEFDWGIPRLVAQHAAMPCPILAANLHAHAGVPSPLPKVRPFVVRELDGVRVALVGLTTSGMPTWYLPAALDPLEFARSVETLEECLPRVRAEKPDVLVLLAHQGLPRNEEDRINEIRSIAARFPEFDVILGGHTHEEIGARMLGGVLYAQAGAHGRVLGRVDLTYDTVRRQVAAKRGSLIPAAPSVRTDGELERALAPQLAAAADALAVRIGRTARDLAVRGAAPGRSGTEELLREAIAEAAGTDLVIHGYLSDDGLPAGDITELDLWKIVPYENQIGTAWLTLAELREIVDELAPLRDSRFFMGVRGLRGEVDPAAPDGKRVRDLRLADGSIPHPRKRLKVAFNSFSLASGGGRFPRLRTLTQQPEARSGMLKVETRDAVRNYLRRHQPFDIKRPADEGLRFVGSR